MEMRGTNRLKPRLEAPVIEATIRSEFFEKSNILAEKNIFFGAKFISSAISIRKATLTVHGRADCAGVHGDKWTRKSFVREIVQYIGLIDRSLSKGRA